MDDTVARIDDYVDHLWPRDEDDLHVPVADCPCDPLLESDSAGWFFAHQEMQ